MDKKNTLALFFLGFGYLSHGLVISFPTIDNPCQNDPTSTGASQYTSILTQLQMTIREATNAANKCQQLLTCLTTVLTPSDIRMINSISDNITGLPHGLNESNMTAVNVFTRTLRHSSLNITIIYNVLEQLVANASMETYGEPLRNVMSTILTVKCRIELTSEVMESNFTTEESQRDDEMMLADFDAFVRLEEAINNQPMPTNEKSSIFLGYIMAHYMQILMNILIQAIEAQRL